MKFRIPSYLYTVPYIVRRYLASKEKVPSTNEGKSYNTNEGIYKYWYNYLRKGNIYFIHTQKQSS